MTARLLATLCAYLIGLHVWSAQAEILTVTQDSFANGLKPDDTNDNYTVLKVRGWGDNTAFLQFDVSGLWGHTISSATLVIDVVGIWKGDGGVVELRLAADAWSEDTLTFNNQPGSSAPIATAPISSGDVGNTISVDITDIVQGWADGTIPNNGLALTSSDLEKINVRLGSDTAEVRVYLAESGSYEPAPVELNWHPPATRSDGTPLSMGEIDSYILKMNDSVLSSYIPGDAVTATVDILWPGEYCFTIATRDQTGQVGPFSDAACWSVFPAPAG